MTNGWAPWVLLMLLSSVLLACGGGAESRPVTTPSGRPGYTVSCEDPADCYEEAGKLCPTGYDILDAGRRVEEQRVANALSTMGAGLSNQPAQRHTKVKTDALIQCR